MGNHRFKLSDMMPNAWFYKLKDMGRGRRSNNVNSAAAAVRKNHHQGSTHFTRSAAEPTLSDMFYRSPFTDGARRSSCSGRRGRRKTVYKPSPQDVSESSDNFVSCTDSSSDADLGELLLSEPDRDSFSPGLRAWTSSTSDIIIDMKDDHDTIPELELPPILTRPAKFEPEPEPAAAIRRRPCKWQEIKARRSISVQAGEDQTEKAQKQKMVRNRKSGGIRIRASSPKLASKKLQTRGSRSSNNRSPKLGDKTLSSSFAIVKSSLDPQSDFKESMMEMIVENNIETSKDLEDLLACYLSLNSKEYHHVIVKAFEQIWFDLAERGL